MAALSSAARRLLGAALQGAHFIQRACKPRTIFAHRHNLDRECAQEYIIKNVLCADRGEGVVDEMNDAQRR